MNPIPARILLRDCLTSPLRPPPSERRQKQRDYILDAAQRMFATHGRAGMAMRNIADALDISRDTLRRHICDIHHLFALVLTAHLAMLTQAIDQIEAAPPDLIACRREALHQIVTGRYGYTARLHVLLDRDRSLLPDDERTPIEDQLNHLAALLGAQGADAAEILFPRQPPIAVPAAPAIQPAVGAPGPLPTALEPAQPAPAAPETTLHVIQAPRPAWPAPILHPAQPIATAKQTLRTTAAPSQATRTQPPPRLKTRAA